MGLYSAIVRVARVTGSRPADRTADERGGALLRCLGDFERPFLVS